ncbi:3'-5' exonuclease [Pedobacter arcticus]|uniref:3'-5' exonuclease n=1 Tax=Pedobacter arcticus TaxID=752140 RepID=UPI000307E037|nr:3'-5' exonuclease [Pedobacter arcticus]
MKLNLKRPLAFFDLESTGVNVASDRIVEISILKALPNGEEEVKTLKIKPLIPIPLESSLIHGIYDEDVKDAPTFKEVAQEIIEFIGDADLAGYNSNKFDIPMLMEEFLRVGINFDIEHRKFVDVQNIFHQMEQRTLRAAYKFYCDKDIINAHSAEADIRATYEVLLAQLDKYEGKEFEDKKGNVSKPVVNDVEGLHAFTNLNKPVDFAGRMVFNDDDVACFNFGKHKGKPVTQVFEEEPSYYAWMMNGDFPLYTKNRLEKFWKDHRSQKNEARQVQKPKEQAKPTAPKPIAPKPVQQSEVKKEKPSGPANEDMLQQLANKFKKI